MEKLSGTVVTGVIERMLKKLKLKLKLLDIKAALHCE